MAVQVVIELKPGVAMMIDITDAMVKQKTGFAIDQIEAMRAGVEDIIGTDPMNLTAKSLASRLAQSAKR